MKDDPATEARKKLAKDMDTVLTERQLLALSDLFHGNLSVTDTANAHGVTRATLWDWQNTPAWRKEWTLRRSLVMLQQRARLLSMTDTAMTRLEALARGQGTNPIVRRDGTVNHAEVAPVPYDVQMRACEAIIRAADVAKGEESDGSEAQAHRETPLKSALLGLVSALPDEPPAFPQPDADASDSNRGEA